MSDRIAEVRQLLEFAQASGSRSLCLPNVEIERWLDIEEAAQKLISEVDYSLSGAEDEDDAHAVSKRLEALRVALGEPDKGGSDE